MAENGLAARSALSDVTRAASGSGEPGVTLAEMPAVAQFTVMARRGQEAALADRMAMQGVSLPLRPARTEAGSVTILAVAPGRWLVLGPVAEAETLHRSFAAFTALCSVVRTDDARTLVGVTGPRAADALAKLLTIDLHPRAFAPDATAATVAGGIAVQVWRLPAGGFGCAVPRSYAGSFWAWLVEAAAEYGLADTMAEA